MNMSNSTSNPCSTRVQSVGLSTLLQVVLMTAVLVFFGAGHAQVKKKPSQKVFVWGQPLKAYSSVDAACAVAVAPDLATYNFTKTDDLSSHCLPGQSSYQTHIQTATASGSAPSRYRPNSHFACLVTFTQQSLYAPCGGGPPSSSGFTTPNAERAEVAEARICEPGWGSMTGQDGQKVCVQWVYPPAVDVPKCGNPTSMGSGCKHETFLLGQLPSGPRTIAVELRYGNQFHLAGGAMLGEPSWFLEPADRRLELRFVASTTLPRVISSRGHGVTEEFHPQAGEVYKSFDPQVSLVKTNSTATPWKRVDNREAAVEHYDGLGRLATLRYFSGGGFDLSYGSSTAAMPQRLTTTTGQQLQFLYTANRLSAVQLPDGHSVNLAYQGYDDPARNISGTYLKSVTHPDSRSVSFDYTAGMSLPSPLVYTAGLPLDGTRQWATVPLNSPSEGSPVDTTDPVHYGRTFFNLSAKTDENGQPYVDFQYDDRGRVLSSQRSGNTYGHEFSYPSESQTVVTHPLGLVSTFQMGVVNEQLRLSRLGRSAPNVNHSMSFGHDANGNVASRDDFNGHRSCHAHDLGRNVETSRVEGLANTAACATVTAANATLPPGARKVSTQWHPDWRLQSKVAEPLKLTTHVYNGQPDPSAGNAIATCAPSTALLPDGKPIAVLCKTIEQATTDANGALGFTAAVTGTARTWRYTYNQHGQRLTEVDPRGNTTTHSYYSNTAFTGTDPNAVGHTIGDLQSTTNAAGHVTQYPLYDKNGRVLRMVDANGVITDTTYTPRGWVASVTVTPAGGGSPQLTSYGYDGVGQLTRVVLPDLSEISYTYDAAHRLTGVRDNAGNTVAYTLDAMGNRTAEQLKDPSGALVRNISRVYDALNRLQSVTGSVQ
jgi:YD repeat-containing protein